jgi:asparagine synthase (glutamine-hydrolysing)
LGIPEPPAANWLRVAPTEKAWPFNEDLERMSNLGQDALFAVLYHDAHSAFLPTILRNFERASMAHGVEVRCPFMDWRLVTYSFSLPSSSKLGHGVNKRVLRDAMSGILPESIRSRTEKVGFQNPMDDWLLRDLKGWVLDQVNSLDFLSSEIWDGHAIRNQIEKDYEKGSPQAAQRALPYLQANVLVRRTTG